MSSAINIFLIGALIVLIGVVIFRIYGIETLSESRSLVALRSVLQLLKPNRSLSWLYFGVILDRFAWSLWMPILNAYIMAIYGFSAAEVGILNSLTGISTLLTQYLAGKLIDKVGYILGLVISEFSAFLASIFIGFTNMLAVLIIALILIGISISIWIPALIMLSR